MKFNLLRLFGLFFKLSDSFIILIWSGLLLLICISQQIDWKKHLRSIHKVIKWWVQCVCMRIHNGLWLIYFMSHLFRCEHPWITFACCFRHLAEPECSIGNKERVVSDMSMPQLNKPHSPFFSSVHHKDWFSKKRRMKKKHGKKTHHAVWQNTQPLSPLREGSPTEAVARLLEHEALTALPKANFNLFHWNGIGDVWWIFDCL